MPSDDFFTAGLVSTFGCFCAEQISFSVMCKRIDIRLRKDDHGMFGMTLRGGANSDPLKFRPLTVTQIRQGGPADR